MLYNAVDVCLEQHGIHWMAPRPRQACAECIKKFGFVDQGLPDYLSPTPELIKHSLFSDLLSTGINWDAPANPFATCEEAYEEIKKQPDFVPILDREWDIRIIE